MRWKGRDLRGGDRRLAEVAKAVGGSYCRLQMPLSLALAARGTVAGHRQGALEGVTYPPFQCIPPGGEGGGWSHLLRLLAVVTHPWLKGTHPKRPLQGALPVAVLREAAQRTAFPCSVFC